MVVSIGEKLTLIEGMTKVFQMAAEMRSRRQEEVDDPVKPCPGRTRRWVLYERWRLLEAVNTERHCRGLEPVGASEIKRVELMAFGHSDYAHKYAIYCAELALGESDVQPTDKEETCNTRSGSSTR